MQPCRRQTDQVTDPPSCPHREICIVWPDLVTAVSGEVHFSFFSLCPKHLLCFVSMTMHYRTETEVFSGNYLALNSSLVCVLGMKDAVRVCITLPVFCFLVLFFF